MSLKLRAINHPTPALDLAEAFATRPFFASPSGAFVGARLICVRRTRKSFILALVVVSWRSSATGPNTCSRRVRYGQIASGRKQARMRSEGRAVISVRWGRREGVSRERSPRVAMNAQYCHSEDLTGFATAGR